MRGITTLLWSTGILGTDLRGIQATSDSLQCGKQSFTPYNFGSTAGNRLPDLTLPDLRVSPLGHGSPKIVTLHVAINLIL